MVSSNRRQVCGFVLTLILAPSGVYADPAQTFEELGRILKADDLIVVTDQTGERTRGRVVDVSKSALVVTRRNRSTAGTETRTFALGTVSEIKAADSLLNGALIGAAAGTGLAVWDYLIDPSEPGNAAIFTVAIGLGTAIGAGIDALTSKVLYEAPRQTPTVRVLPLSGRGRQGVLFNVRF